MRQDIKRVEMQWGRPTCKEQEDTKGVEMQQSVAAQDAGRLSTPEKAK